jgi:hypothetical protein
MTAETMFWLCEHPFLSVSFCDLKLIAVAAVKLDIHRLGNVG